MFGMGFGEMMIVVIVGMVVFGPKELPKVLRRAGIWAGKIRRFALDMRVQSGIDDALRSEGLDRDIAEIRKLTRGELDGVVSSARSLTRFDDRPAVASGAAPVISSAPGLSAAPSVDDVPIDHDREYPNEGPDAYGAIPDTATIYAEGLPLSPLADDPLYTQGDASAPRPSPPPPAARASGVADEERATSA